MKSRSITSTPKIGKTTLILTAVLVLLLLAGGAIAAEKTTSNEAVKVPLLINVLKGVTMTQAEIDGIVKEANKIAKKAGIQLEFDKSKHIITNANDQGNNNDKIESGEDSKLDAKGQQELNDKFGSGKGIKVYFTNEIHGKPNTYGLAPHSKPVPKTTKAHKGKKPVRVPPVIYLKKNSETNASKGNDLIHEVFHVLTLGKGHTIDKAKGVNADNTWHSGDKKNIMYPYNPFMEGGKKVYRGSEITPDQAKEIKKTAKTLGKTVVVTKTSQDCKIADAIRIDSINNQITGCLVSDPNEPAIPLCDIQSLHISGGGGDDTLTIDVVLREPFPPGFATDLSVMIFLDTPNAFNNLDIYVPSQVFPGGYDPIANILPHGFVEAWHQVNEDPASWTPLTGCYIARVSKLPDTDYTTIGQPYDHQDVIHVEVPIELLGLEGPELTVFANVFDFNSGNEDFIDGILPLPAGGPTLGLETPIVNPGDPITVIGENFNPGAPVDILLDDEPLITVPAGPGGELVATAPAPPLVCGEYFLTARNSTDSRFDFSVLEVQPIMGDYNCDNRVDLADLLPVAQNWLWSADMP